MGGIRAHNTQRARLRVLNSGAVYRQLYEVVQSLPTQNIKTTVIYLVPAENPTQDNEYEKWLYVNNEWESLGSGGFDIFVIDETSVPESASWGDHIPTTYAGQTGKIPEINFYNDKLWCLYAINEYAGQPVYNWIEIADGADLADLQSEINEKMDLSPINPTAEEIEAMPSGQLYGDTVNHKVVIKGGQELYDSEYLTNNYRKVYISDHYPTSVNGYNPNPGDLWMCLTSSFLHSRVFFFHKTQTSSTGNWRPLNIVQQTSFNPPPDSERFNNLDYVFQRFVGDEYIYNRGTEKEFYKLIVSNRNDYIGTNSYSICQYTWFRIYSSSELYTKTEIDNKGFLTLETLPIYNGGVE